MKLATFDGGDLNLYGYVLNNPVNLIDIDGLMWSEIFIPTEMGPNQTLTYDKKNKKWKVYDFETNTSKDWK